MADRTKREGRKLRRAKNAVRGAFNRPKAFYLERINRYGKATLSPTDLVVGGFAGLDETEAEEFLKWFRGFPSKAVQAFPLKPIENAVDLSIQTVTIKMPLITRINWLSTLIETELEPVAAFVGLADQFERKFLVGEYSSAQEILDSVKNQFGLSVWFIEMQIALLQRWKGLDAQKEFARTLGNEARRRPAGVTAYWISQRNEEGTAFGRFRARMERNIENWNVAEPLRDAYAVILAIKDFLDFPDVRASSALGALATSSLPDAYIALIGALQSVFTSVHWMPAKTTMREILLRLPKSDSRVRNMLALVEEDFSAIPVAQQAIPSPEESDFDVMAVIDSVSAHAIGNASSLEPPPGSPLEAVIDFIDAAIMRGTAFEQRIEQGIKLLANLRPMKIAGACYGFARLQDLDYAIGQPGVAGMMFLDSARVHPWHAQVLPRDVAVALLANRYSGSQLGTMIGDAINGRLESLTDAPTLVQEIGARAKICDGEPSEAATFLTVSRGNADDFALRRLGPVKVLALLRSGALEEAVSVAGWIVATAPEVAPFLPLKELIEESKRNRERITDKLSLSILFGVYLERFDDDDDAFQHMQFAYEDYVLSQGVQRPSELVGKHDVSDTARLTYFLKHIARPEVMDVSFWLFKKSRDTLSERIQVCSALIELAPFDESELREEIKEITTVLNIQDGLEDVDRSRVYVDIPKLQRWAELELREGFERYKALLLAGVKTDDPGEFDKVLKDFTAGKGTLDKFSDYPKDEAGQLLIEIYTAIAEKYLHDPDIGLDAYLSMRIRHGSLAGHIRGPLEEQGLLAVRDQGTNQYRMLRRPAVAASETEADWISAERCVEVFSRKIDDLIDGLAKERLQVKSDAKPKGLFVFDPLPLIIYYLRANIDTGSSFAEFLTKVVDALHIYLAQSLKNVSAYISNELNAGVARAVEEFRVSIDEKVALPLRAQLQELIGRASPELQASLEHVASWFALDPENARRALRTMEQIVQIAIQATNNAHRGFEPKVSLNIEDLGYQSSDTLITFTDILFTILDNIYSHSGLGHEPEFHIEIANTGEEPDERMRVRLRVTNKISPGSKSTAGQHRLQRIRDQIDSGAFRALSKVEGGTGFLKLKRIVAADNRQTLDFGYTDGKDEFFVEISMILFFAPDVESEDKNSNEVEAA